MGGKTLGLNPCYNVFAETPPIGVQGQRYQKHQAENNLEA
jgi:hypothetical protein